MSDQGIAQGGDEYTVTESLRDQSSGYPRLVRWIIRYDIEVVLAPSTHLTISWIKSLLS